LAEGLPDRSSGTAIARATSNDIAGPISPKETAILLSAYEMSNVISLYAMMSPIDAAELASGEPHNQSQIRGLVPA
jgi:hypothetical protein